MDYVGADDGVLHPKPEADMFLEFQKKFGLKAAGNRSGWRYI